MLEIHCDVGPDTKFSLSHSLLPRYIDPQNVSTKKKPFSTFHAQPFSHTLDLVLPEEIYKIVQTHLGADGNAGSGQYARVHMKLGEVLEGDFFTEYVKKGNIIMLSEGRPLVDNLFTLVNSILRLELDRPTYERCGLQGKPIEDGGRKHQKARWAVVFDLRSPSMIHGKKGFGRLEWACKNVLNQSLTWLWYNFNPTSMEDLPAAPIMTVDDLNSLYEQEDSLALLEYLDLLSLDGPRVKASDRIDPHLSRYEVPDFGKGLTRKSMVRLRWRGLIPPQFVQDVFLVVRKEGMKVKKEGDVDETTLLSGEERWFSMSASAFGGGKRWTVMQWAGRETVVWEIKA